MRVRDLGWGCVLGAVFKKKGPELAFERAFVSVPERGFVIGLHQPPRRHRRATKSRPPTRLGRAG